mgnify:CR=1 FL=1
MRKTRSDCTVGSFEKNMDYLQESLETKMVEILARIKR